MKKVIIALIILVVLSGAGVTGMLMAGYGPFSAEKTADTEGASPVAAVPEIQPVVIDLGDIPVPIIQNNQPYARVMMRLNLIVAPETASAVRALNVRIRSAVLADFMNFLPSHMQGRTVPEKELLETRVRAIVDQQVGKGAVQEIQIIKAQIL